MKYLAFFFCSIVMWSCTKSQSPQQTDNRNGVRLAGMVIPVDTGRTIITNPDLENGYIPIDSIHFQIEQDRCGGIKWDVTGGDFLFWEDLKKESDIILNDNLKKVSPTGYVSRVQKDTPLDIGDQTYSINISSTDLECAIDWFETTQTE